MRPMDAMVGHRRRHPEECRGGSEAWGPAYNSGRDAEMKMHSIMGGTWSWIGIHSIHGTRAYADMLARVSYLALKVAADGPYQGDGTMAHAPGMRYHYYDGMYMDPS